MGGLGNHLPGYHFAKASLYETTIKDGTKYHLFRVTYTTGNDEITTAPANDDGGVAALFLYHKFLKWERVDVNTAKVSKRSHNCCYGSVDNHHQKSHPYFPQKGTEKAQT